MHIVNFHFLLLEIFAFLAQSEKAKVICPEHPRKCRHLLPKAVKRSPTVQAVGLKVHHTFNLESAAPCKHSHLSYSDFLIRAP